MPDRPDDRGNRAVVARVWDGQPQPVALLPACDPGSLVRGLNDAATPVGQSHSSVVTGPCSVQYCGAEHDAVAWSDAVNQSEAVPMMDIGTMQQPRDSDCRAINNVGDGQVVGWGFTGEDQFDCKQHALLWNSPSATEVPQDLGAGLPDESWAEGLNNATPHPLVVGLNLDLQRALIWEHDGAGWTASELDDRVGCAGEDIRLKQAHDINDDGWIVAWGVDDSQFGDEAYHLYVLAPYESLTCAADIDGSGTVEVMDLLAVIVGWTDACDSVVGCLADTNGDCAVDVTDLIAVISGWGVCPGSSEPAPASLQTEIEDAGLLYPQDWDYFTAHVDEHTFRCWMEHYLMDCNPCLGHNCGGPDPYSPNRH